MNKRIFCLTLLISLLFGVYHLVFFSLASSQELPYYDYVNVYDLTYNGDNNEYVSDIAVDSNGDVYICGQMVYYGSSDQDIFLVKINQAGDLVWNKTWGVASEDDVASGIAIDSNGDLVVVGYCPLGMGVKQNFIVKFDSNGNYLWNNSKIYSDNFLVYSILMNSDDTMFLMGKFKNETGEDGVLLGKFDPNGNDLWNVTWCIEEQENPMFATFYNEDSVLITGTVNLVDSLIDFFIWKVSLDGESKLSYVIENAESTDSVYGIKSESIYFFLSCQIHNQPIILKFDENCNQVWNSSHIDKEIGSGVMEGRDDILFINEYNTNQKHTLYIVDLDTNSASKISKDIDDLEIIADCCIYSNFLYVIGYIHSTSTYDIGLIKIVLPESSSISGYNTYIIFIVGISTIFYITHQMNSRLPKNKSI